MKFQRKIQEINAGSMADIAFLLLIFFLVSTTINTEEGIQRKLPPAEDSTVGTIQDRNVFDVRLNGNDELLVNGESVPLDELKSIAMAFIDNPEGLSSKPAKPSHTIVNLQNTRNANYNLYIQVQDELTAAYYSLRNQEAMQNYASTYRQLSKAKQQIIREKYPMKISEATIASND